MHRTAYVLLTSLALATAVPLHRTKRQVIDLDDPGASNLTANEVCFSENEIYQRGDIMPNLGPCEECKCEPPSIVCNMIKCPVNSGCRTIQRSNHCCPDYKCECEHNGEIYSNGERLDTPDEPCQVCYCKGGEVMCTSITCYHRDDCEPQFVSGQCCPKYDHCPLRDMPASSNDNSNFKNKTYVNSPKREMQPWLLTKSVYINAKPTTDSAQHNAIEDITEKPTEGQTDVIISDWLSERRTTIDGVDETYKTTTIMDTTVMNLDSNVIQKNENIMPTDSEESLTAYKEQTTANIKHNDNDKNLQVEVEILMDKDIITDYTVINTTNNPNIGTVTEINVTANDSKVSTVAFESEEELNIADLLATTLSPEISTIGKIEESIDQNIKTTAIPITDINVLKDVVSELNKETESSNESVTNVPYMVENVYSLLQNEETTNADDGSGGGFIENENEPDRILHEELSRDFDNLETTKFYDHKIEVTTPIASEIILKDEANKQKIKNNNEEEIKENFIVVDNTNPNVMVEETGTPEIVTTIASDIIATTANEEKVSYKNNDTSINSINTINNKPNVFESLAIQINTKDDITLKNDVEITTEDDKLLFNLQTTQEPETNINLKEELTKEDENESEVEQNSSEDKTSKSDTSEFVFRGNSNENEGENNQQPPVLELDNQLPFLQLGGHGSLESSTTSELYSSEINIIENDEKSVNNSNKPSLRTVPETNPAEGTKSNTSTHITLTPGDLKILAEYLINEKIKPAEHLSQNGSNYNPTEWLKGNLTSNVKIASILNAANISIEIMNKNNTDIKIKLLNEGHLLNAGKIVNSTDSKIINNNEMKNSELEELLKEKGEALITVDNSTISTKLFLVTDEPTRPTTVEGNNNISQTTVNFDSHTEKNIFETDIFEINSTKYPANDTSITETTQQETTEKIVTTEETYKQNPNMEDKSSEVSTSRKVRIPEMESLVKKPSFSVNLEDNDLTIVRDFLKKHFVLP